MNPIRREFYLIEGLLQNPLFSLDLECQKEKQKWLNFGSRVQGVVLCRKSEPLDLFKTVFAVLWSNRFCCSYIHIFSSIYLNQIVMIKKGKKEREQIVLNTKHITTDTFESD